ncbi:MAG TPA: hypothetical protein VFA89_12580 [Terriglobales bacterium]|nr:hypothetical protein [Terriglobales bacterium]
MSTTTTAVEIDGLKTRLKETWMAGDYDRFSRYMEQGARIFYEQLDIPAGCQLLDVLAARVRWRYGQRGTE